MSVYHLPEYGDHDYRGSEEVDGGCQFQPLGVGAARAAAVAAHHDRFAPQCESPIELQLAGHLAAALPTPFTLVAQHWLDRFRMDFAVVNNGRPCLFIECDGKEFHSTEQQIANDLDKDDAAAKAGIPLMRFTGSSIYRDPKDCCRRVVALLEGLA